MKADKKVPLLTLQVIVVLGLIACQRQQIPTPKSNSAALVHQGANMPSRIAG